MAPLAEKITEYIIDHQDDAAQEERWRTMMKRDTAKSFREQRALLEKVDAKVEKAEAEVKAQVEKVEAEVKAQVEKIEAKVEDVQRALDLKLDQILDRLGTPRP